MKRLYLQVLGIFLLNVIPAYAYAGENHNELDMNKYGLWVSYGFFVIILLFIIFFLYSSSHEEKERVHEVSGGSEFTDSVINIQSGVILAPLKLVSYSIISIIFLYIIIFVLLIT
jgi:hypothetical protein